MERSRVRSQSRTTMRRALLTAAWILLVTASVNAEAPIHARLGLSPAIGPALQNNNRYFSTSAKSRRDSAQKRRRWKKAWIASLAAFALVNVLDAHSSAGRKELNPLLRGADGRISMGRTIGLKSAIGGGMMAFQWAAAKKRKDRNPYKAFAIANTAASGGLAAVAAHNYKLGR